MGGEQAHWLARLRTERANITAAVEHALAVDSADLAIRLVAPLGWYFFVDRGRGRRRRPDRGGAGLLRPGRPSPALPGPRRLRLAGGDRARPPACAARRRRGPPEPRHLRRPGDRVLRPLLHRHGADVRRASVQDSWATAELAVDAAERSGDRWCRAIVTLVQGELYHQVGDTAVAERMLADAGDAFAALGDRFCHLICVTEAAEVAELRGEYDRAIRMFEEGLAGVEAGFSAGVLAIRTRLANLEILRGNLSLAESMHREVARPLARARSASGRRPCRCSAWPRSPAAATTRRPRSSTSTRRGPWAGRRPCPSCAASPWWPGATPPISRGTPPVRSGCRSRPCRWPGGSARCGRSPTRSRGWPARWRRPAARSTRSTPPGCSAWPTPCGAVRAARCRPPSASTSTGPSAGPEPRSATRRSRAPSRRGPRRMPTRPRPTR